MDKELKGTERKDRNNLKSSGDLTKLPSRPVVQLVSGDAKKFYKVVGEELIKMGVLSKVDLHAFCIMANWFGFYCDAYDKTIIRGVIQVFKSGARNISPEFAVMQRCDAELQKYYRFFGLTPYHRERLAASVKKSEKSEGEQIWAEVLSPSLN